MTAASFLRKWLYSVRRRLTVCVGDLLAGKGAGRWLADTLEAADATRPEGP
jgi:hypothetical protein